MGYSRNNDQWSYSINKASRELRHIEKKIDGAIGLIEQMGTREKGRARKSSLC